MITRTTNKLMLRSAQSNLESNMVELARLQERASSQKVITRPSDDPTATAASIQVRAQQRAAEQYGRNIDDGNGWLVTADAALSSATTLMNRVRVLTVQGANSGVMSPAAKQAIATELTSLRDELLTQANADYLGRTIFAGTSDAKVAFDPNSTPPYSYAAANGSVERRVGADATVRVDSDGLAVFGSGANSVFQLIDDIAAELTSGADIGARLNDIDARMEEIREQHALVGTRQAQIERAQEAHMQQTVALEGQRAGIEDVDLAKAILDLQLQEVAYKSALAVTARVLQPTLMDFLR